VQKEKEEMLSPTSIQVTDRSYGVARLILATASSHKSLAERFKRASSQSPY